MKVGAALFNGDHGNLAEEMRRLNAAGVDFVHLDVFDGYAVPDLGFAPRTIEMLRPLSALPFEVHLGARESERFLPALARAGVNLVCVHAEACPMLFDTLFTIREHGMRAGVALSLGAPLELLWPVLPAVDAVLLLARVVGEGTRGAEFNATVVARAAAVAQRARELGATVEIEVAGGVRRAHLPALTAAGVTAVALGSGLYRAPDMAAEVAAFRAEARR